MEETNVAVDSRDDAAKLASKLSRLIGKAEYVQKTGRNTFHGYKYATEADFLALMKPLLSGENIAIIPSVVSVERVEAEPTGKGRKQWLTNVTMQFSIIDGDTGYKEVVIAVGCGIDSEDKGVYKALTGCVKYFLSKLFLIETGDDPEKDDALPETQKSSLKPNPPSTVPQVNHTPAVGKEEPRPGEKKPDASTSGERKEEPPSTTTAPAAKEKTFEQATAEALQQGEEKKAATLEQKDVKKRVTAYSKRLGGAGSDGSKNLRRFILRCAGLDEEKGNTAEVSLKDWGTIFVLLETAKTDEALAKLIVKKPEDIRIEEKK